MAASDGAGISCWVLAVCTLYFFFSSKYVLSVY